MAWRGLACLGVAWLGLVRRGFAWRGLACLGLALLGVAWFMMLRSAVFLWFVSEQRRVHAGMFVDILCTVYGFGVFLQGDAPEPLQTRADGTCGFKRVCVCVCVV